MAGLSGYAIVRLESEAEVQVCAQMMATSDPWITLGRTYETCLRIIRDPTRETYLLRSDVAVAGFVIICMTGAFVGYIQTVCLDPKYRGLGLGSRLVEFAERRILAESPNVFMCVSSFNHAAQRLYQRLGYQVIGELSDYIVEGHSEILLRKTVGPLTGFRSPVSEATAVADSRDSALPVRKLGSSMREARLKPEFADLYPTLTPGQWEPAARVAEVVLARLLLLEISDAPLRDRLLNEEHFEFRGETPDGAPRNPARSRAVDRAEQ